MRLWMKSRKPIYQTNNDENPYWQKCVLCADSKDIIKRIPDNSIDFILTDPPYNLGQHSTGKFVRQH